MDNKRTLTLVLAFGAFILLWTLGVSWFQDYMGWTTPTIADDSAIVDEAARDGDRPTTRADGTTPTTQSDGTAQSGGIVVANPGQSRQIVLGSADVGDPAFAMEVTLSTVGAGVERVLLNDFAAEVDKSDRYIFETPYDLDPDASRPLATRSVELLGQTIPLNDVAWQVDEARTNRKQAVLFVDLEQNGQPVAKVEKLIRLFERTETIGGEDIGLGGFEVKVEESIFNRSGEPLSVRTIIQGPTSPPRELETGFDRTIMLGYDSSNGVKYEALQVESFDDDDPKQEFVQSDRPLYWAGAGTIYFNAIVRPIGVVSGDQVAPPAYLNRVVAEALNPDSEGGERRVALRFVTNEIPIAAGESAKLPLAVFFGPKERDLLENDYFSGIGVAYDQTLRSPFGCTWCVFQPVVDVLVMLLSFFHWIFRDWGLAIIGLVCLVRVLLHPITKRSQKNLLRMSKLAPKMQAAKEKYGDDREKMAQAMAEMMPEQTSALLFGCLPMLLQTPIWIALYSMLQATFELRHAPFLYGWTWISDLSRPDNLIDFGRRIELLNWPFEIGISGLHLLPLLMGVVFYLQIKIQPQPTTAMTDDQRRQQKLIQTMMVVMFPLFLYSAPSGLNLYILTSTTIGIIESKLIRRNLKIQEEADEAAEAEAKRTGKKIVKERPTTGMAAKFATMRDNMMKRVEAAQREAQKRAGEQKKK